ncbi:hypothetical protein LOK49_LG12G01812 [Camellia lanceoleosa]|uniref:Uncharacterized protein n=1 Tax=Camellia lanceoleosa TaxID=1840588 RepID=A0ACC0FR05_9ERIC|nr:hypothetical protein LOK49_LG12G01812 [Camellia lanceoleosa]
MVLGFGKKRDGVGEKETRQKLETERRAVVGWRSEGRGAKEREGVAVGWEKAALAPATHLFTDCENTDRETEKESSLATAVVARVRI